MQAITIYKNKGYIELTAAIQSRLGAPFNQIPLKICIIQAEVLFNLVYYLLCNLFIYAVSHVQWCV